MSSCREKDRKLTITLIPLVALSLTPFLGQGMTADSFAGAKRAYWMESVCNFGWPQASDLSASVDAHTWVNVRFEWYSAREVLVWKDVAGVDQPYLVDVESGMSKRLQVKLSRTGERNRHNSKVYWSALSPDREWLMCGLGDVFGPPVSWCAASLRGKETIQAPLNPVHTAVGGVWLLGSRAWVSLAGWDSGPTPIVYELDEPEADWREQLRPQIGSKLKWSIYPPFGVINSNRLLIPSSQLGATGKFVLSSISLDKTRTGSAEWAIVTPKGARIDEVAVLPARDLIAWRVFQEVEDLPRKKRGARPKYRPVTEIWTSSLRGTDFRRVAQLPTTKVYHALDRNEFIPHTLVWDTLGKRVSFLFRGKLHWVTITR